MDLARLLIDGEQGPKSPALAAAAEAEAAAPNSNPLVQQQPHVCAICSRPFSSLGDLMRHEPSHAVGIKTSWPTTWPCRFCSGKFGDAESLQRHERQHEQHEHTARPSHPAVYGYACTYLGCRSDFETPLSLQRHQEESHGHSNELAPIGRQDVGVTLGPLYSQTVPYRCDRINGSTGRPCNIAFSRLYDLSRHEETVHNARKRKREGSATRNGASMTARSELASSPVGRLADDKGHYPDIQRTLPEQDSRSTPSQARFVDDVFGQPYQAPGVERLQCHAEGCGERFESSVSLDQHRMLYHSITRGGDPEVLWALPQANNRSRTHLTWKDKRAMCQYHEDNPREKQTSIAVKFGVERSTVSKTLSHKDLYLYSDKDPYGEVLQVPRKGT